MTEKFAPWDVTDYMTTREDRDGMIALALEDYDSRHFMGALETSQRAKARYLKTEASTVQEGADRVLAALEGNTSPSLKEALAAVTAAGIELPDDLVIGELAA